MKIWIVKTPRIPVAMEHAIAGRRQVLYVTVALSFRYAQMAYAFVVR